MKCQILCLKCGKPKGTNIGNRDLCHKSVGAVNFEIIEKRREFEKAVSGVAKFNFRCDICNDVIKPGDRCYAETICQSEREYHSWETQWIETGEQDANS